MLSPAPVPASPPLASLSSAIPEQGINGAAGASKLEVSSKVKDPSLPSSAIATLSPPKKLVQLILGCARSIKCRNCGCPLATRKDLDAHLKQCAKDLEGIPVPKRLNLAPLAAGRSAHGEVLMVTDEHPVAAKRWVESAVWSRVDKELGASEEGVLGSCADKGSLRTFLFVCDHSVVGALVTERIHSARWVVVGDPAPGASTLDPVPGAPVPGAPELAAALGENPAHAETGRPASANRRPAAAPRSDARDDILVLGNETAPAEVGVMRVWVHAAHRRKGIARSLLDAMRLSFSKFYEVDKRKCAFSSPTDHGRRLAEAYLGKPYLAYVSSSSSSISTSTIPNSSLTRQPLYPSKPA